MHECGKKRNIHFGKPKTPNFITENHWLYERNWQLSEIELEGAGDYVDVGVCPF